MHTRSTPDQLEPATTIRPARHGRRRIAALALAAASLAGVAMSATAAPAGAQLSAGYPQVTAVPYNPCLYLACPVSTSFSFNHAGYYTYAVATFPQGSTGTVTFTMKCADGFTKTKSTAVATYIDLEMSVKDEHPGAQVCKMTQTVHSGFTTTVKLEPPDDDILWPVEYVRFTNT